MHCVTCAATSKRNGLCCLLSGRRWPEDLPPNSCIVLSGNDDLCHAEQVQKMVVAAGTAKVGDFGRRRGGA
jgi:hypothetical protein